MLRQVLAAIDASVPIVAVSIVSSDKSYDFEDASQLLLNIGEELSRRNPGAVEMLRRQLETGFHKKFIRAARRSRNAREARTSASGRGSVVGISGRASLDVRPIEQVLLFTRF